MRRTAFFRLGMAACLAISAGCTAFGEWSARTFEGYDAFARSLIRDFHASGLDGVRERVKTASINGNPEAPQRFREMRQALPTTIDSIRAYGDASIEEDVNTGVARLHYRVYGPDRTAAVELWIERTGERYVAETIRMVPDAPGI